MSDNEAPDALVTASYTIPAETKAKIEQLASEQDLNASQVVRRILADYFSKTTPTPAKRKPIAA